MRPTLNDDDAPILGTKDNPEKLHDREILRNTLMKQKVLIPEYLMYDDVEGVITPDGRVVGEDIDPDKIKPVHNKYLLHNSNMLKEARRKQSQGTVDSSVDRIEELYGISTNVPLREKIERLLLAEVNSEDIIELLTTGVYHYEPDYITSIIAETEQNWESLGSPLSEEELKREKGKALVRLQHLKKDIYTTSGMKTDPRLQQLIFSIEKEIANTMGLDKYKTSPDEEASEDDLSSMLDKLSPDKLSALLEALG